MCCASARLPPFPQRYSVPPRVHDSDTIKKRPGHFSGHGRQGLVG